jgi:hypothetical protein
MALHGLRRSSTEELARTRKIRSRIIGKRGVIDIRDFDAWIDEQLGSPGSNQAKAPAPSLDQVSVRWVYEKRRPRAKNPIPCLPMGRYIRFDGNRVLKWLNELATDDLQPNRLGKK